MNSKTLLTALAVGSFAATAMGQPRPDELLPADEALLKAQIEAASRAERDLQAAAADVRARRERLERESRARALGDPEELREGSRIVNGVATIAFPGVGALLMGSDAKAAVSECTGTLIGCRTFLTANHCFGKSRAPSDWHVYFHNAGFVPVQSISAQHKDYNFPEADLAVLKLSRPVRRLPLAPLNAAAVPARTGGTIVGFGRTGGNARDYGVKRLGTVETADCTGSEKNMLCWNYNAPIPYPGENSNTCAGDSGGPLFVRDAAAARRWLQAGVTSGGTLKSCLAGDHSFDVDVHKFGAWIAQEAGADLGRNDCAPAPGVDDPRTTVLTGGAELAVGEARDFKIAVHAGTALLLIAMNGVDNPGTNFNLFVRRGSAATFNANDCASDGASNYAVCEFASPAPGDWYIRVDQQGPLKAEFQVVATLYPPPIP